MKNKGKFRFLSALVLSLVLWTSVLLLLQSLLVPKYQSGVVEGSMVEEYYRDKSSHELLMVGDCEVYENISTIELWKKYGITSYIRGSAQQLAWQSYYLLEDALRYETPKVVVFNVLSLKYDKPQSEAYNRMTIDGMRWSSSKVNAIRASATDEEKFADYLFPLFRYHSRWQELTDDDFIHLFGKDLVTHNGYYMRVDSKPQDEFPDPIPLPDYTLGEKPMSYLDRMTELCKEKGIELVLIKAPTEYPHWYDEWDRQIVDYAEKNGLSYLNFIPLQNEIGLDMSVDTYDAGLHLNLSGAEKLADYFGGWLTENCDLTDNRSDPELSALWQEKVDRYENAKTEQLRELEENGKLVSLAPIKVKETNSMKIFVILAVTAALCLSLIACGGTGNSNSTNSNDKTTAAPSGSNKNPIDDGFSLTYKGATIAIDAPMASVVEKLGEPLKCFETTTCAFQGVSKVYTYSSIVIQTYPKDDVDYVWTIELKDDTVSTGEGVSIGDSKSKVTEKYGNPTSSSDNSASYAKGRCSLSFFFDGDSVRSITYMPIDA